MRIAYMHDQLLVWLKLLDYLGQILSLRLLPLGDLLVDIDEPGPLGIGRDLVCSESVIERLCLAQQRAENGFLAVGPDAPLDEG